MPPRQRGLSTGRLPHDHRWRPAASVEGLTKPQPNQQQKGEDEMSKATKTRKPSGIQHSNLATPAECVGVQAPHEPPSAICHVALRCRRCGLCAYHCSCWAELEPPITQSPDAPLSFSGTQ